VSFFELFQPGLKHLREEKERQKMLVSKPTHGGGAPLGIDLDAGTAKITIRPKASPDHHAPDGLPDGDQISPDAPSADDANPVAQHKLAGGDQPDESAG
jgi:Family of unknown function (DUF6191)